MAENYSRSRMLLFAGMAVVLLLLLCLLLVWAIWGWPSFEVKEVIFYTQ